MRRVRSHDKEAPATFQLSSTTHREVAMMTLQTRSHLGRLSTTASLFCE